jgi:hypothetical protein
VYATAKAAEVAQYKTEAGPVTTRCPRCWEPFTAHPYAPEQPAPMALLIRDIAADFGVTPLDVCAALRSRGLGDYSVNMAVTDQMARELRRHFVMAAPEQPAQGLTDAVPAPLSRTDIARAYREAHEGATRFGPEDEMFARLIERAALGPFTLSCDIVLSILYVALFPSIVAYFCWNKGVDLVGPNRAGLFINLIPAFASLLSLWLLGESIQPFHIGGMALILGGMALFYHR